MGTSGSTAVAMGNYFFTTPEGTEVKVEYSFGYVLDSEGRLRINLHHSPMPYEVKPEVTRELVLEAQKKWGDGIVEIAAAKAAGQDFEQKAHDHIMNLYAYGHGNVLFKPTLAAEKQFRETFEGALSYFVATNDNAPEDTGFAIKGWTAVKFENEEIITSGNTAMAMGNYFFTNPGGEEVKVEYSFGYVLDTSGTLRINLHHSSMPYVVPPNITKEMVEAAQKEWGDGIVKIAQSHTDAGNFTQEAVDHITKLYAYGHGPVLFKPTLASEDQFRGTFDGALSYFVATNNHASEDKGFAIKGWTAVRFENEEFIISGNMAMAMGNYFFTNPEGDEVKVEYSFGYVLDADGNLRINLHHSSMPYEVVTVGGCDGNVTRQMVLDAQQAWGEGIINISTHHANNGTFETAARVMIEKLYAYGHGTVLFKPTLAVQMQFRNSFEAALSYFVATNNHSSEDTGFAIKGWTNVTFDNEEIIMAGNTAMAMGNYFFTNGDGVTQVEYSFGYVLDTENQLRINLHHSSLPYSASR